MARTLCGFPTVLHRIVYKIGSPVCLGKIVRIHGSEPRNGNTPEWVDVRWAKDGTTQRIRCDYLNDFESLVEDTERKAVNHRAALESARKIAENPG